MVAKMSSPSRKNGRFSGKNVSNVERFRMTVSASTCPKSGFTVRSSVSSLVRCALASSPADAWVKVPCSSELASAPAARCSSLPSDERAQLEPPRRREVDEIVEATEVRHDAGGAAREEGPVVGLLPGVDEASHLKPPRLDRQRGEAEDGERDAELDAVAAVGGGDLCLPDGVPVGREVGVVEVDAVEQHAGGVDREVVGADAVVAAVDVDPDAVRGEITVASLQAADDRRVELLAVDADVEVVVVVEDAHLGALAGGGPFVGVVLRERVGGGGGPPRRVVQVAVDPRGRRRAHRADVRAWRQHQRLCGSARGGDGLGEHQREKGGGGQHRRPAIV